MIEPIGHPGWMAGTLYFQGTVTMHIKMSTLLFTDVWIQQVSRYLQLVGINRLRADTSLLFTKLNQDQLENPLEPFVAENSNLLNPTG